MKRFLLAGVAWLAVSGVATAADIAVNEPIPAPVEPSGFDWNGFYAGVHGGFGWGSGTKDADFLDSVTGGLFGAQVGYNYQVNDPWLVGFETDIAYSGLSDNVGDAAIDLNWLGSTTARIGFTYDKWLFYGKGGVAYGDVEAKQAGFGSDSKWAVGWTAGAGVEYGFTPNLTGRLEYDYVDLGSKTMLEGTPAQADVGVTSNAVKAGLNYKF